MRQRAKHEIEPSMREQREPNIRKRANNQTVN